jgi:hypothetical protein
MVQHRRSRVPIYTNYEGDDDNLEGDGDGDVDVDDDEDTSPQANGVPVTKMVSKSPRSAAATKQQNLLSPREEESFRLRRFRKLRKIRAYVFS